MKYRNQYLKIDNRLYYNQRFNIQGKKVLKFMIIQQHDILKTLRLEV